MAITVVNSQGTKAYLVAEGTTLATVANVETAIASADAILCIQTFGDISSSRSVQEYKCLSSDETAKSIGSISLGNISLELLFNSADSAGQAELRSMYADNTKREMIIELNDEGTTSPSYVVFTVAVASEAVSIAKDAAVLYKNTIEICSLPVLFEAV
ncbi:MAG: hypothetical protein ACO29X_06470 [Arcobacteraceae bacterium]